METLSRPAVFCPFPPSLNPFLERARHHLLAWVEQFGLVQNEAARYRFHAADFALFAASTYPAVPPQELALMCDWFAWLFLVDDQLDDGLFGTQVEQAEETMTLLLSLLDRPEHPEPLFPLTHSIAFAALADLWERTHPSSSLAWRARFVRHVAHCFAAAGWEAHNRVQRRIPDLSLYIEKRRDTGAIYICLDLIEIVEHIDIQEHVYQSPVFQTLVDTTSNVVCWCNDLFSLEKEQALGEYHNLVLVVQQAHGLSLQGAVNHTSDLIEAEVQQFLDAERQATAHYPEHTQAIQKYVAGMKSWMRGNLDWSRETKRYQDVEKAVTPGYLEAIM